MGITRMKMKYYKDADNNVYAYEDDGSQDEFIRPELIPISEDEAKKLANPGYSHEQLVAFDVAKKSEMFAQATYEIAWRQDAVDVGIATEVETAALTEWKKYRVMLMRVDTSKAPDIEWPVTPSA